MNICISSLYLTSTLDTWMPVGNCSISDVKFHAMNNIDISMRAVMATYGNSAECLHAQTCPTQSAKAEQAQKNMNFHRPIKIDSYLLICSIASPLPGTVTFNRWNAFPYVVSTRISYVHPGCTVHSWCSRIGIGSLGINIVVIIYDNGIFAIKKSLSHSHSHQIMCYVFSFN